MPSGRWKISGTGWGEEFLKSRLPPPYGYAWSDGIMAGIRSVFSHKPNTTLIVEYVDNDSAHKPIREGGAGPGPALVSQFISLHNGSFPIESEVGHYTRAMVHFPMRQPDESSVHTR